MNNGFLNSLRPSNFDEFVGQEKNISNLKIYIEASKIRETSLDHILLYGPAGTGKTSLAYIIAKELNQNIIVINASSIDKPKDIIIALSKLNEGDILFIDEIHALKRNCEEILYSAMEDYYINLNVSANNKSIYKFNLPPFTLIGATTNIEYISKPLYDRFSINIAFDEYNNSDLKNLIKNISDKLNINIDDNSLNYLSQIVKKTPRIVVDILKRISDYMLIKNIEILDINYLKYILKNIGIYNNGLNKKDIIYLNILYKNKDKPLGINTISSLISESIKNIEITIEPFLIKEGYIKKTNKGRLITEKGSKYLKNNKYTNIT